MEYQTVDLTLIPEKCLPFKFKPKVFLENYHYYVGIIFRFYKHIQVDYFMGVVRKPLEQWFLTLLILRFP